MNEMTIGTVGGTYVRFRDAQLSTWSSREGVVFAVELHAAGLDASVAVLMNDDVAPGLREFLTEVVDAWSGWDGTKRWVSLEHELTVEVERQSPGRNLLRFTVQEEDPPNWSAMLEVSVEAGEEMSRLARDVCEFVESAQPAE